MIILYGSSAAAHTFLMRIVMIVVGVILAVFGVVFALQGIGLLGGSAMTGDPTWAIIGPVLAVIGLVVLGFGLRRRR